MLRNFSFLRKSTKSTRSWKVELIATRKNAAELSFLYLVTLWQGTGNALLWPNWVFPIDTSTKKWDVNRQTLSWKLWNENRKKAMSMEEQSVAEG